MTADILIGIDAGTSLIKSVAFTIDGKQLALTEKTNSYDTVNGGGVEQDMARTWIDVAGTLRGLAELVPGLAERTAAIGVTGQGDGTWLIDKDGNPVAPAWLWLDSRSAEIAEAFTKDPTYPKHYETTGTGVSACQQSMQLAWMKRHRPEVLARAATAFHCKDWLYFKLTGHRVTDPSEGNFTFGDYRSRNYQPAVLDALCAGDCKRLLPRIVDGTLESAPLSEAAAKETGLKAGTPISLGFVDVVCAGLGGGLYARDGATGCSIEGSTGMHMRLIDADKVHLNGERSGYTMAFPAPGICAQMQSNMAGTLNIDWLLDMAREVLAAADVSRSRKDLLAGLDERVLAAPPAAALYHPYISQAGERGPFLEPAARAQFIGLQANAGFFTLMRAVYEGLAMAARDCYLAMGSIPAEVRMTGGAARSRALRKIFAAALGARVRTVAREEAGAAGAAMMAAVQQKIYPDMEACVATWVDALLGPIEQPDAALAKTYDSVFPLYLETRKTMRPLWRKLRQAEIGGAS